MAVNLSPVGGVAAQFFDNAGNVLTGGKLYTYAAGTTTPQTTYTTSAGNVAWSNPIILDAAGRVSGSGEIWLTDGTQYKFILRDSNDVLIATYDNIIGINSNFVNFTNEQEIQTATAGQTVFNLTTVTYSPGTNSLSVFVDGVNQYGPGAQYAYLETDSDTVTFVNGLHVGALVKFTTSQLNTSGAVDAEQVSYNPPFVDAVPTNVEAKLAQYVSVKDFGAVGDGATNDTVAIQNAVNYAAANPVNLYFPAGSYRLTARITVISATKICITGAGRRIANLVWDSGSSSGGGIDITYTDWLYPATVQGLSLMTKAVGLGTALKITGQDAPSVTTLGPNVNDIEIIGFNKTTDCWDVGIEFDLCWYICLTLVSIKGLEETAPPFTQSAGIILTDCQVIFATKFSVIHVEDAVLEQNVFAVRGEGFSFNDFELVGVTNGFQMIAGAVAPGINIGPGHINAYKIGLNLANYYQAAIHDILFYKTFNSVFTYTAMQLQDCNFNRIHDNTISGWPATTSDTYGIVLTGSAGTSDYNTIHDNYFRYFTGSQKVGIILSGGAGYNNVHDNNCDNTITALIVVDTTAEKTNYINRNLPTSIQTLEVDSATPSVGNDLNGQWNSTPTVATTITNFLDGYVSQVITVLATNTNTTLQNNANISLSGGVNYAMGAGQLITLRKDATLWREMSRSV